MDKNTKEKKRKRRHIILYSVVAAFLIARYGWRIRGLKGCDSVYSVDVTVADEMVSVEAYTVDPFARVIGHIYKIDGDKLYVGAKFREIFGTWPGDKDTLLLDIPVTQQINEVYWCTKYGQNLEWKR